MTTTEFQGFESLYVTLPIQRGLTEVKVLRQLLTAFNGYIAGGYARYCLSQRDEPFPTKDVDVWFKAKDDADAFVVELERRGATLKRTLPTSFVYEAPPAWKGCPEINVITTFIGTVPEVLKDFDFTVTMAFLGDNNEYGGAHKDFLEHDQAGSLVVHNIICPIGNLKRAAKYFAKGYRMSAQEMLKFYAKWDGLEPEKKAELGAIASVPHEDWTEEDRDTYRRLVWLD